MPFFIHIPRLSWTLFYYTITVRSLFTTLKWDPKPNARTKCNNLIKQILLCKLLRLTRSYSWACLVLNHFAFPSIVVRVFLFLKKSKAMYIDSMQRNVTDKRESTFQHFLHIHDGEGRHWVQPHNSTVGTGPCYSINKSYKLSYFIFDWLSRANPNFLFIISLCLDSKIDGGLSGT